MSLSLRYASLSSFHQPCILPSSPPPRRRRRVHHGRRRQHGARQCHRHGDDTEMYICYLCTGRNPILIRRCPIYWDYCHLNCFDDAPSTAAAADDVAAVPVASPAAPARRVGGVPRDPRGRGVLRHEAVRERQLRHRDHAGLLPDRLVPPLLRRRRPRSRRRRSPGGGAPGRRRRRLAAGESDGSPRHAAAPRRRFPAVRLTGDDRYSGNEGHHRRRVTTAFGSDGRRSCTLIRLHMIKKKKNSASIVR